MPYVTLGITVFVPCYDVGWLFGGGNTLSNGIRSGEEPNARQDVTSLTQMFMLCKFHVYMSVLKRDLFRD